MEYAFVEYISPDQRLPSNVKMIALTGQAMFQLETMGIDYMSLEDFYASYEIKGDISQYLKDQLAWINDFDVFIKDIFPEAKEMNLNLASEYFSLFKYPIDNIITTVRILKEFINKADPGKIWYVTKDFDCGLVDHHLGFIKETSLSQLAPLVFQHYGISFERMKVSPKEDTSVLTNAINVRKLDGGAIKRMILGFSPALVQILFKTKNFIKGTNRWLQTIRFRRDRGKVLFLCMNDSMEELFTEFRKLGYKIFLKEGEYRKEISSWPLKRANFQEVFKEEEAQSSFSFDDIEGRVVEQLMPWIIKQCGIDVWKVVRPRIEKFLMQYCPETIEKVRQYIHYLGSEKIDYIVTYHNSLFPLGLKNKTYSINLCAALIAARFVKNTKSIGLGHGVDAFEYKSRFFSVSRHYDVLLYSSEEEVEHEEDLKKEFGYRHPSVFPVPYFRNYYAQYAGEKGADLKDDKQLILFVPILHALYPRLPMERGQNTHMEFICWHRALLEHFAQQKNYHFIWKGLVYRDEPFDLFHALLQKNNYANVSFRSEKLTYWLPKVERVICDTPSSAYFQAIYAGKSVLTFYQPQYQTLRKNALQSYGESLKPFDQIQQGLDHLDRFLNQPSEKYRVRIPDGYPSFEDILKTGELKDNMFPNKETKKSLEPVF